MILYSIPEPIDPVARQIHLNLQGLLEAATVQQAESSHARRHEVSGSRRSCGSFWDNEASTQSGASRGPGKSNHAPASSHHAPAVSIHDRMGKKQDMCDTINTRRRTTKKLEVVRKEKGCHDDW